MADVTPWVFLLGLVSVIAVLLWKFGSLERVVVGIDSHVKTVTDPTLANLQAAVGQVYVDVKTVSAPVQTLGEVAKGLHDSITTVSSQIGDIKAEAAKIITLGQRYEDVEKQVRDVHSVLIGSYSKGKAGEEALKSSIARLAEMGYIKENQEVGRGRVEFAIAFNDGKVLAIDSKIVSTGDIVSWFDDKLSAEERSQLADRIKRKVRDKIPEVQQYIDPPNTLPTAIMAVPDSVMEIVTELIPEAASKNIILLGYSAIPQLITYFVRIHGFYRIEEDVEKLQALITKAQQEISRLDDGFFANRFEKPLGTLDRAVDLVKATISGIANTLALRESQPGTETPESGELIEEKRIAIPAPA